MHKKYICTKSIPSWIILTQCICFTILYSIWILPETILIRHICLVTGSLLSIWIIYQYRTVFLRLRAFPVWLIISLFVWAILHIIIFSNDYILQYAELTSIWKRTAIGAVFGLGFGLALTSLQGARIEDSKFWGLIYFGLSAPMLIYIVKFIMTNKFGAAFIVPEYLKLYPKSATYYLPKTAYVCFCLPVMAVALGQLLKNIGEGQLFKFFNFIYLLTIPAVFFVFYGENIKNGIAYSAVLITLFLAALFFQNIKQNFLVKLFAMTVILMFAIFFLRDSIEKNDSWGTFWLDSKVAVNTENYQHWKNDGIAGYPMNELGKEVSRTNYERIAWGKVGLELLTQNPLGFGLIEGSFGRLSKIKWPESNLSQSHSGWIDLFLGLGIPGAIIIFSCLFSLLFQLWFRVFQGDLIGHFSVMAWCILFSLAIMWCTTEISQRVYFDNLIFFIALASGISLGHKKIGSVRKN